MIKKSILRTIVSAMLLLTLTVLAGCGGKSKQALLECVPADAEMVFLFDVQSVLDQLEFKKDGDSYSYCKELKQIIDASGVSRKDFKTVLKAIDQTEKAVLVFTVDEKVWITFKVKDGDEFTDFVEDLDEDIDFDKVDGFKVFENIAVKDNQVWICGSMYGGAGKIDTDDAAHFMDLSGDAKFTNKYAKVADAMCEGDVVTGSYYSIDGLLSMVMNSGILNQQERAAVSVAMSMVFDDAECVLSIGRLNDNGIEGETRVLNSKLENAKFLLPMDKIDAGSLTKIDNNSPLVMAFAISPELVTKVMGLIRQHVGFSSSDEEAVKVFESLSGTNAFSFAGPEDFIASISFKDSSAATSFGSLLTSFGCPYPISTAGSYMILRSNDNVKSGGASPQGFDGQYFAAIVDFSKVSDKILTGYDASKWGKILVTLGPDGQGVVLKSEWKIKNPVRTMLDEGFKFVTAMAMGRIETSFGLAGKGEPEPYDEWETVPYPEVDSVEVVADTVAYVY